MGSWLLKLLSKDMKTENKKKINQQTNITNEKKNTTDGKNNTYHRSPLNCQTS